ncbi:apolipoprotein N-acyltransferase [Gammaproteobacteria bacterium 42_54_T18]|nr:apolipoprotein N-acyltransferase [Gammaproteobacteria bacterium 42_54_T18]
MPAPWLAGIAMTPLFIAADNSKKCAAIFGLWAFAWWCWSIFWMLPAAIDFIGISPILASILWGLLCALLSLPYWVIGRLWHRICVTQSPLLNGTLQTLLFTALASCTQWFVPANPAHSLYIYPQFIQIVDIGGIPLLLFGLVSVNLCLAKTFQNKSPFVMSCTAGAITLLCFTYSHIRIFQFNNQKNIDTINIAMLQPNLQREDSLDRLFHLTENLTSNNSNIDLVVWPEFPPAFSWQENKSDRDKITALIETINKPILLNSGYIYQKNSTTPTPRSYYNAAQLISSKAELLGSYHKQHLVPFFEYLPFEATFPRLRHWFPDTLRYVSGDRHSPLGFSKNNQHIDNNIHIAPLICFEMLFPHYSRYQANQGANIIINLSNDSWFKTSKGSINHFSLAIFRSIENKLPWVRVSNGGISASVSGTGEIDVSSLTNLNEHHAQVIQVDIKNTLTLYQKIGDLFLILASIIVITALASLTRPFKSR